MIFEDGTNVKIGTDFLNTGYPVCETTANVSRLALIETGSKNFFLDTLLLTLNNTKVTVF
jgi:squalene cyclase